MKKPNRRSKSKSVPDSSSPIPTDDKQGGMKQIGDLETENEVLKKELKISRQKLEHASPTPMPGSGILKESGQFSRRSAAVAREVPSFSSQKHKTNEAPNQLHDEIQKLKAHKVKLQCKMKLELMSFRSCKASLEKEILQLKKAERRNKYVMHLLAALNQKQKLVLERKMEEAFIATKRLKELVETRKTLPQRRPVKKGRIHEVQVCSSAEREQLQGIEDQLESQRRIKKICAEYECQIKEMVGEIKKFKQETQSLKDETSECLSLDNEVVLKDTELADLKEEVTRLSCLLSQMSVSKSQLSHPETSQVDPAPSSISVASNKHVQASVTSEMQHPEGLTSTGEKTLGDCCSCSKRSLCKVVKFCGCRAAGKSCGPSCGCVASKCTNRIVASLKLGNLSQCDTSEDVARKSIDIKQCAFDDTGKHQHKVPKVKKHRDRTQENGLKKAPLRDIGNTMTKSAGVGE